MGITKEAEKVIYCLYKIYLERRNNGIVKSKAIEFEDDFYEDEKHLSKLDDDTVYQCLLELKEHNYIKMDVTGGITLLNSTIVYMENRFKKGFGEVVDFLTKFIP